MNNVLINCHLTEKSQKWCPLIAWPTGAIAEELDSFIYVMLISVMIVHFVLSFRTEKPYATLQHIVHIFTMVIIWDLEWLTIFIPIISKYQIWFVELFVGKKMIHKWSQNICIHMSFEDEIDIWTLFIASWQFYLHIHYFLFTIHNKKLCISFLVMLNMFRIEIWHLHLVCTLAISCTPWHLIFKIVTSHLLEKIT